MEGKIMEQWKDIEGYEGIYQISSHGRVKSLPRHIKSGPVEFTSKEKILKPIKSNQGYLSYILCNNGERRQLRAHRLVAQAFIPNPQNKPEVNHIDGNKQNNNVINLEWVTRSENQQHAWDNGLKPRLVGEKNGFYKKHHSEEAKLKLSKQHSKPVINIDTGEVYASISEASSKTGINLTSISNCCRGKQIKAGGYRWEYKKN